jgi:hypothetical protein
MSVATKAIETIGTIDANRQLVLDDPPEDMYTVLNGKPFHDPG